MNKYTPPLICLGKVLCNDVVRRRDLGSYVDDITIFSEHIYLYIHSL